MNKRGVFKNPQEARISRELHDMRILHSYEQHKITYTPSRTTAYYIPDFYIPHKNIYIEYKGYFSCKDRQKHLDVRKCHPHLDIRIVFHNPNNKLSKHSRTTYGDWCNKHKITWAIKSIPKEWLI